MMRWSSLCPLAAVFLLCSFRRNPVMDDLTALRYAVLDYRKITGELPSSAQGLSALKERPASLAPGISWSPLASEIPSDPWGNPYRYVLSTALPDGFGLYSTGPDGISLTLGNDADDRNTWSPREKSRPSGGSSLLWWLSPGFAAGWVACRCIRSVRTTSP